MTRSELIAPVSSVQKEPGRVLRLPGRPHKILSSVSAPSLACQLGRPRDDNLTVPWKALRQAKPLGPGQHDVQADAVEDSLVLFLADLPQVTVAGQDLTPGHQRR